MSAENTANLGERIYQGFSLPQFWGRDWYLVAMEQLRGCRCPGMHTPDGEAKRENSRPTVIPGSIGPAPTKELSQRGDYQVGWWET